MNGLASRRSAASQAQTKDDIECPREIRRKGSTGRMRRGQMNPPGWKWTILLAGLCIGVVLYAGRHHVSSKFRATDPNVAIRQSDELLGLDKIISIKEVRRVENEDDQVQEQVIETTTTSEPTESEEETITDEEEEVLTADDIDGDTESDSYDQNSIINDSIEGGAEFAPVSKYNPAIQVHSNRKRTYVSFRSYLSGLLSKDPTWKNLGKSFPYSPPELLLISYQSYKKYSHFEKTLINQVGSKGGSCIGGGKGKQLACKQALVKPFGCTYDSVKIQPPQWNIKIPDQCNDFFAYANQEEHKNDRWIMKPGAAFHGDGIEIHTGTEKLSTRFGSCTYAKSGIIVQAYLANPVLWKENKFDFRTYLLLASTKPLIAFTHEGFVRRAEKVYHPDSSDPNAAITNARSQGGSEHFYGFDAFQKMLTEDHGFDADYLTRVFEPHNNRVSLFLTMTAAADLERKYGRFQLYALDWMMDSDGSFHLLESNGNPMINAYPGTGLTPSVFETMLELVHLIHTQPKNIPGDLSVKTKFMYAKWQLIFNEIEEQIQPEDSRYNPCKLNEYAEQKNELYGF